MFDYKKGFILGILLHLLGFMDLYFASKTDILVVKFIDFICAFYLIFYGFKSIGFSFIYFMEAKKDDKKNS